MAKQLIDSLTTAFEPQRYHDEYREKVLELIERKAQGEEIAGAAAGRRSRSKVPDLMAALEASLAAVKDPRRGESKSDGKSNGKSVEAAARSPSSRAKAGAKK